MTLADTRERALPAHEAQTLEDYLVYLKHVALYDFAAQYCAGKTVLDLGCGEGYGSAALARAARQVLAADYSFEAVLHAQSKYASANLAFVVCDAQRLPFRADAFDTAISFEVIEHVENVRAYLTEIKRVAKPVSTALFSTPNRLLRLLPFQKPWNRFHRREYDPAGLARALRAAFGTLRLLGVTAVAPILEIEKRRVKQNPFKAYPRMLAQMLIPQSIYEQVKRTKPSTDAKVPAARDHWNFSARDFEVSPNALRECITLIAVCRAEEL
ncbi:MAG: class I SAM-dependent methyltransferase [Chloroflexota bacterium]|nr:class I SAM-dependent methyltransferase [Chloroflexota bacterium]